MNNANVILTRDNFEALIAELKNCREEMINTYYKVKSEMEEMNYHSTNAEYYKSMFDEEQIKKFNKCSDDIARYIEALTFAGNLYGETDEATRTSLNA